MTKISSNNSNYSHLLFVTFLLFAAAFSLYILHLVSTNYRSFSNDIDGHRQYIEYIVHNHSLPKPNACWECYQPPLYYILAAFFYAIAKFWGILDPITAVRFLSLGMHLVFIFFSSRLLQETIKSRYLYYIALALLVFWPMGVTKASMINNDVPLYMAQLVGFYYLMRWWQLLQSKDLYIALFWSALALNFKNTGVLLVIIIACVVLYRVISSRLPVKALRHHKMFGLLLLAITLAILPLGRNYYYYRIVAPRTEPLMVPTIYQLSKESSINDRPIYYLTFDFTDYIAQPFAIGESKRELNYFWNTILKTSLFGNQRWQSIYLATILSFIELGMLVYLLCSSCMICVLDKRLFFDWMPFVIFVGVQITAVMMYRIIYPNVSNQDYRFIYASTTLLVLLYTKTMQWYHEHRLFSMYWLGIAMSLICIVASVGLVLLESLS